MIRDLRRERPAILQKKEQTAGTKHGSYKPGLMSQARRKKVFLVLDIALRNDRDELMSERMYRDTKKW